MVCESRRVSAGTWHRISDIAASAALGVFIAVVVLSPVIGVSGVVVGGVESGVRGAYLFAGGATVAGLYLLLLSVISSKFQVDGVPVIEDV